MSMGQAKERANEAQWTKEGIESAQAFSEQEVSSLSAYSPAASHYDSNFSLQQNVKQSINLTAEYANSLMSGPSPAFGKGVTQLTQEQRDALKIQTNAQEVSMSDSREPEGAFKRATKAVIGYFADIANAVNLEDGIKSAGVSSKSLDQFGEGVTQDKETIKKRDRQNESSNTLG